MPELLKLARRRQTTPKYYLVLVFVAGALFILLLRFLNYSASDNSVHYHANFNVYINGQKEEFKESYYYEEEAGEVCALEASVAPGERAHMHDHVGDVVHVEDHSVTWGHFFQNLGWTVNPKLIQTPGGIYLASKQRPVTFVLNGKITDHLVKEIIGDRDKLLVYYGKADRSTLMRLYRKIPDTAQKYNVEPDPASCSGQKQSSFKDRLENLF